MQRSNLKLVERRKKPSDSGSSQSLDAWVWAERISVIGLFALAVGYTLVVVQELFVPVVTAWVMGRHLVSDRPIGPETWRAESGGGAHRYGDGRAPYPALAPFKIFRPPFASFAYWIGRTAELVQPTRGNHQLLNQPSSVFDDIC